jgi:4-hydroxybenzoate polyprenyltransferase
VPAVWQTALRLGRVSNLPTVWTNVLAGMALGGGPLDPAVVIPVGISMSLLYVAGMYLNDAFDRAWDAENRPERPIPAGHVRASTVFTAGFAMMAAALALLGVAVPSREPLLAALLLAGLIVLYDKSHKGNPLGPVIMGLCRVGVYVTAALTVSANLHPRVLAGSAVLLLYLVVLSRIAKEESRHPKLSRMVGKLIAGISLIDGGFLWLTGHAPAALAAVGAFATTRILQRRIPGT